MFLMVDGNGSTFLRQSPNLKHL
jgi:hypothetical protein